ncbi:MAG: major facilitator superfamily 1 [Frankiales bacterium]|nr:major facilitator superfamily 1 [Frankiales bacterium]
MSVGERVTYRSVLANREFAALFVSQGLSTLGDQLARIAVAILVFERTGSDFAATFTFAISYLTYLVGGPVLSAVSDRRPKIAVMIFCDLARAPVMLLLCLPDQPVWSLLLGLTVVGVLAPPFDSARSSIQPDLLGPEAYPVGNALINVVLQLGQVLGFLAGGVMVAFVSARGALGLDAATFFISAGLLLAVIRHRPAAQHPESRGGLLADTAAGFRLVARAPDLRRFLTLSIVASMGLVAGEGLAVPVAAELGRGSVVAGVLTAALPAGFVVGSLVVARLPEEARLRLLFPLTFCCLVPLAASPLADDPAVLGTMWFVAGLGSSLNLIASSAYVQACPPEFRARAYGVAVSALFGCQGLVLLGAGSLAEATHPRVAITFVTGAMLALVSVLPGTRIAPQGNLRLSR